MGLIGLVDIEYLSSDNKKRLDGIYFQDFVAAFLKFKNHSRFRDIQVFVLLAQFSSKCWAPPIYSVKKGGQIPELKCLCGIRCEGLSKGCRAIPWT